MTLDVTHPAAAGSIVALVGMHTLEVREDDLPIQAVAMLDEGVFHHGIGHRVLVIAGDVEPAARAGLLVGHPWSQSRPGPAA